MGTGDPLTGPERPRANRHAYGNKPDQFGDLYLTTDSAVGSILLIHGGFWRPHRGLEMTTAAASAFALLAWNVWNIEYRRPAHIAWQETLDDCERAADHFFALLERFRATTGPRIIVGHSAGGHLAARRFGLDDRFDAMVSLNGVLDFALAYRERIGDGAAQEFVGADASSSDIAACDPTTRLPTSRPAMCLHSHVDERVPFHLTASYVEKAINAGDAAELIEIPGHHTAPIEPEGPTWPHVTAALNNLTHAQYLSAPDLSVPLLKNGTDRR